MSQRKPPDAPSAAAATWRRILEGSETDPANTDRIRFEVQIRTADGDPRAIEAIARYLVDDLAVSGCSHPVGSRPRRFFSQCFRRWSESSRRYSSSLTGAKRSGRLPSSLAVPSSPSRWWDSPDSRSLSPAICGNGSFRRRIGTHCHPGGDYATCPAPSPPLRRSPRPAPQNGRTLGVAAAGGVLTRPIGETLPSALFVLPPATTGGAIRCRRRPILIPLAITTRRFSAPRGVETPHMDIANSIRDRSEFPCDHLAPRLEAVATVERVRSPVFGVDVEHHPVEREVLRPRVLHHGVE